MIQGNSLSQNSLPTPEISLDDSKIQEQAAADALNGQPKSDALEPSPTEQNILDRCNAAYLELNQKSSELMSKFHGDFLENEKLPTESDFKSVEHKSESAVQEFFDCSYHNLLSLQRDYQSAAAYWRYFKLEYQIDREASYPLNRHFHVAFLVLFIVVEAILNASFFAGSHALGFFGGLSVAVFISLFSILLGYFTGKTVYPHATHQSEPGRWKYKIGIVAWLAVIFCLHLAVAHYRDLSEQGDASALSEAIPQAYAHPFALSLLGYVMLGLGFLLSVLAFADGTMWDDQCPGFGAVDRRFKETRASHESAVEAATQSVSGLIKSASLESTALRRRAENSLVRLQEIAGSVEPLKKTYLTSLERITDAAHRLLLTYRDRNVYIRGALPAPSYFKSYPAYKYCLDVAWTESLPTRIASAKVLVIQVCEWDSQVNTNELGRRQSASTRLSKYLADIGESAKKDFEVANAAGIVQDKA